MAGLAWAGLVALLPWSAGLPLLLLLATGVVGFDRRIPHYARLCRLALRWGLPGWLYALQRVLGGDLLAWGAALLGALVGFSLVVLLESMLDHRVRRSARVMRGPEWDELALAPMGPGAHIIELSRVAWRQAEPAFADPEGAPVQFESNGRGRGRYVFAAGIVIDKAGPQCCFGPGGRWFAAVLPGGRGHVLWDRHGASVHRLAGWQLSGWDGEQPWLARGADGVPAPLHEVLGQPRHRRHPLG
ncbi:hypothetical protein [Dyella solisilvae]|uniref:hypothetical protein n=1 Tax=Dyella solisilvae TaxID=1920168 RepID=UPI001F23D675|nr:hypothetical protein [Dyella solisilvae]